MSGINRIVPSTSYELPETPDADDAPVATGSPSSAPASTTTATNRSGSTPSVQPLDKATAINFDPIAASALESVRAMAPDKVDLGDTTRLLAGVKDGDVQLEVPLTPGKYRVKGVAFEIPPGAVMKLDVQVRDGKLVPAEDKNGRATGAGTKVTIDPPLDLPLWIDGNGAYLRDQGGARASFHADLGGFFDIKFKELPSTDLATIVSSLGKGDIVPPPEGGAGGEKAPLTKKEERQERREIRREEKAAKRGEITEIVPEKLLDISKLKFNVGNVTLKDDVIDTGTTKIDLAPGSKVSITGSLEDAKITGDVGIDGIAMNQDGVEIKVGAGRASFEARVTKTGENTLTATTTLTNVSGTIEGASIARPKTPGDTDPDRVALGKTKITNASFSAEMSLVNKPGALLPSIVGTRTRGSMEAEGELAGVKLSFKDAKGDATFRAGPSTFKGKISMGEGKLTVDGSAQGITVDVRDLQAGEAGDPSALDLHHATVEGDATISFDAEKKAMQLELDAKRIDARIDDLRGSTAEVTADLGRTDVSGSGKVKITSAGGITLEGKITAKVQVDDLRVKDRNGKIGLDFSSGSTVTGELRRLEAGPGGKVELDIGGKVDAGFEALDLNLPDVTAQGSGQVKASADIKVSGRDVLLTNVKGQVTVAIDDAKIDPKGGDVSLDAGRGSKMTLNVEKTTIGTRESKELTEVRLGKGSKLDMVLDGGQVVVGGQKLTIEKGGKAQIDITSLEARNQEPPAIRGKLTVDATVTGASASVANIPGVKGVKVEVGQGGKASAKVTVDDVKLGHDGSVSMDGVRVSVRGKVDKLTGAVGADGTAVGTLSVADVKSKTAAEIGGAKSSTGAGVVSATNPLDLVKNLESGTFEVEIPIEGKIGEGAFTSASFAPGTKIKAAFHVEDGKVVPSKTKITINNPGDGPLWVTVKGAYMDDDGTVRANLGGMYDFAIPKLKNLPLEMPKLVDHLSGKGGTGAMGAAAGGVAESITGRSGSNTAVSTTNRSGAQPAVGGAATPSRGEGIKKDLLAAADLQNARIEVKNAHFSGGTLAIPGGSIDLADDGVNLSISGTPKAAVISGRVAVDGVKFSDPGFAIETGKGSLDLRIETSTSQGTATVKTTVTDLDLDVKYAVQKKPNGDYIHLAEGKAQDGTLGFSAKVPLGANGLPTGKPVPSAAGATFSLPSFTGRIEGGRVTVPDGSGTAQIDLGKTSIKGSVSVDGKRILVTGEVGSLDASVQGFQTKPGSGAYANVDAARVRGSGKVTYSSESGLTVDAKITHVDVNAKKVETKPKPR